MVSREATLGPTSETQRSARDSSIVPKFSSSRVGREGLSSDLFADWLRRGARPPSEFLRFIGLPRLLAALEQSPELRTRILVQATGAHARVVARKSTASAIEDLEIALEEAATTAEVVVSLLTADEWVGLVGHPLIWEFLTTDEFWLTPTDAPGYELARDRVLQTAHAALLRGVLPADLLGGCVDAQSVLEALNADELREMLAKALAAGARGEPFTHANLLSFCPREHLLNALPPRVLWQEIVIPAMRETPPARPEQVPSQARRTSLQPPAKPKPTLTERRQSSNPAPPSLRHLDGERARVCVQLEALDRLPPRFVHLPLPVLLSIEGMYGQLAHATDTGAQLHIIRSSFSSDQHCARAALALLELLNPKLLVTSPEVCEETAEILSIRLLREERRRAGAEDFAEDELARGRMDPRLASDSLSNEI